MAVKKKKVKTTKKVVAKKRGRPVKSKKAMKEVNDAIAKENTIISLKEKAASRLMSNNLIRQEIKRVGRDKADKEFFKYGVAHINRLTEEQRDELLTTLRKLPDDKMVNVLSTESALDDAFIELIKHQMKHQKIEVEESIPPMHINCRSAAEPLTREERVKNLFGKQVRITKKYVNGLPGKVAAIYLKDEYHITRDADLCVQVGDKRYYLKLEDVKEVKSTTLYAYLTNGGAVCYFDTLLSYDQLLSPRYNNLRRDSSLDKQVVE